MEENKNTENEKKNEEKKDKHSDEKKFNLTDFISVHKGEFKKIVWPSKDELLKQTGTVIVVSLIVGLIIFAYDSAISFTYEKTMNMVKGSSANTVVPTTETETTDAVNLEGSQDGDTEVQGESSVQIDVSENSEDAQASSDEAQ